MTFYKVGWRYLLRHPWQSILMILGITLGVAVVVAIDLANASASRAFDLSTETIAGKATHQITAGPSGLDEGVYTRLRQAGVRLSAPVVLQYIASPELGGRPIQLLGVDPLAEAPFRNYLSGSSAAVPSAEQAGGERPSINTLVDFLTVPGAIVLSEDLAERYDLALGQDLALEINGQVRPATITGLLQPADSLSRRALESILLADISTAQELSQRVGRLDRIDLIIPDDIGECPLEAGAGQSCADAISALLPAGVSLETVSARQGTIEEMTSAFRLNLTALSLLALVVGMFLIYNTMTFSVVQRRSLFGVLRCLGATRREVFQLVVVEALAAGMIGAVLGSALGILLGQGAVRLVTQSINDLFFVLNVSGVQVPIESLVKGALLGILATLVTAAPPAWEAASVPPRLALSRSGLESKAQRAFGMAAGAGVILTITGILLLVLPSRSLVISFSGTFAVIVGFALLVPLATGWLMRIAARPFGAAWGALGRMAPRGVTASLSRTSIAVMALMVAVSVTIGVNLMVSSFRATVVAWLEQTLAGDIYISAPSLSATAPSTVLDMRVLEQARQQAAVVRADVLRAVTVDSPNGPVSLAATDNSSLPLERIFISRSAPPEELWQQLEDGAVLVSEPLANRIGLPNAGGSLPLSTASGVKDFPVAGVFYDYASTQGIVIMALPVYRQNWQDEEITAIALRIQPDADTEAAVRALQDELAPLQALNIRSNLALRQEALAVFDRTFAITGALQLLATVVAFIGVLSALLSLELERQHERGILRSIGLTVRQLWSLTFMETSLIGSVAGILAMPAGYVLALILIYIINRRSFGWTLQMQVDLEPFIQALILAVLAAVLAGIYPARRMTRMQPAEALRSE
jgi:putative ABC transport system permease protein